MSHQTGKIVYQIRTTNILILKRGYPILFPALGVWMFYPWLLWNAYHMHFSIDMLYGDSIYYAQILLPIFAILSPLIILKDYTDRSCRELISVYKRGHWGDVLLMEGYYAVLLAVVMGALSIVLPDIIPELVHMLAVSFLYNSFFYLLTVIFSHVMMPFLIVGMYHFMGLSWMDNSGHALDYICFLDRLPISLSRCIVCIFIGILCLVIGGWIEQKKR